MKENFKKFCIKNIPVFLYIVLALVIELVGICSADGLPYISRPLYTIVVFGTFCSLLFIFRSKSAKTIVATVLLFVQGVLNILMVFIYDANGTHFDWAMIHQRTDGMVMIEDLQLNLGLCITVTVVIVLYIFACLIMNEFIKNRKEKYKMGKFGRIFTSVVLGVCVLLTIFIPTITGAVNANKSYAQTLLYGSGDDRYQQFGITSNSIYELFNGTIAKSVKTYNEDGLEEFIYDGGLLPESDYHGISEDNNLVVLLVETFEWFAFVDKVSKEQSLELFPNINKFMDSSLIAEKHYSREKTDCSEILLNIGSNSSNEYVNYGFENNEYPHSLVNMFKANSEENGTDLLGCNYFHQNVSWFYNRDNTIPAFGYDNYFSIEKMAEYGLANLNEQQDERTLDSDTIYYMQNEMFPETQGNEQYMTFWMTYSMHGGYEKRQILEDKGYYDKLDSLGVFPENENDLNQNSLRTYVATVMDFDKAVGIMMDKLEANGQLDNTTIIMCADHNAYYNNLSSDVKGVEYHNSETYRVPFMIYDNELKTAYEQDHGTNIISKFTCEQDVLPTIFDIFGIEGYKNLYFGTSIFVPNVEGIIYSRSYRIFVTDKVVCYSANNLLWTCEGFTNADKEDFINRATTHLNKLEMIDKIYNTNYFKNHQYVRPS